MITKIIGQKVCESYQKHIDKVYAIKEHVVSSGAYQQSTSIFDKPHFNSIRYQLSKNPYKIIFIFMNIGIDIIDGNLQEEHKLIVSLEDTKFDMPYMLKYNLQENTLTNNRNDNVDSENILDIIKNEITEWMKN